MNISFEWLSDYLNLSDINPYDLAELMSRTGIEIDSVYNYSDEFSGLKVGHVKKCKPHPDSEHLHITEVDLGYENTVQIVCGAPNIQTGIKVIVAPVGANLPGGLKIQYTELRGVNSEGMICSLQELGIPDKVIPKSYQDGIYYLPEDAPVGSEISDYLMLNDPILNLDLTPNRADALSVLGTAYEIAAVTDQSMNPKEPQYSSVSKSSNTVEEISLSSIDRDLAPHFSLRMIEKLTIEESPLWLQMRLMKMGIRPLNNVVDVTNYVMLLFGQPMHAYDYDRLPGRHFSVRLAKSNESLETLDDVTRTLTSEDIVVTVDDKPVGLAGVMGGSSTHVTEKTQRIVLESARFNPSYIRKTAKRHNLRSESSIRNEKGLNIETVDRALDYASNLIANLSQGKIMEEFHSHQEGLAHHISITTSQLSIEKYLGMALSLEDIEQILQRLQFDYRMLDKQIIVEIPHRRWDIKIEADLVEEIARIYGYDQLSAQLPHIPTTGSLTHRQRFMRFTRRLMESQGLTQVQSYVLTSKDKAKGVYQGSSDMVNVLLPMSEDRASLRQSLFYSLLEVAQYNMARQQASVAIYETGSVFQEQSDHRLPNEKNHLAIVLSGKRQHSEWFQNSENYDFYDLKGIFECFIETLQLENQVTLQVEKNIEILHPGRTASIHLDHQFMGVMGQIHPQIAELYDLPYATLFLELDLLPLINTSHLTLTHQITHKFPSSSRDIAMLVNKEVSHQTIINIIKSNGGKFLTSVHLFDRYQGKNIANDMQSLAYQLTFQNPEATIKDEMVNEAMAQVTDALMKQLGVEIR